VGGSLIKPCLLGNYIGRIFLPIIPLNNLYLYIMIKFFYFQYILTLFKIIDDYLMIIIS